MRYRLVPAKHCPQGLCDKLSDAIDTTKSWRLYFAAKSAYRPTKDHSQARLLAYVKKTEWFTVEMIEKMDEVIQLSGMGFNEIMLLPVLFDTTPRPRITSEVHSVPT